MKLNNFVKITADLTLASGLHIGAGDTEIHIGGIDNAVVKHPYSLEPYIPGSSLKGKIRSLLEWHAGVVGFAGGNPIGLSHLDKIEDDGMREQAQTIIKLFGMSGGDSPDDKRIEEIGSTRLAFWDCPLNGQWVDERKELGQSFTEAKSENTIDRISGTARNPRQTERVPAGSVFDFQLTLKTLDGDDEGLLETVLVGLKLLEYDSLGGSGSRGYGKLIFDNLKLNDDDAADRFSAVVPFGAAA
jgi:CRISPR-associated protein Csm3